MDLGDYVNYEVDLGIVTAGLTFSDDKVPVTDWRIFYADENNVYLIASDYLPASKFPEGVFGKNNGQYNGCWVQDSENTSKLTTSGNITTNNSFLFTELSKVTTTNTNYQAAITLLDSSKWSCFAKSGYVDDVNTAVIGSPTVEMWMASWNDRYGDTLAFGANATGYQVGLKEGSLKTFISGPDMQSKPGWNNTLYYPHSSDSIVWNNCHGYLLSSPSTYAEISLRHVYYSGGLGSSYYNNNNYGVRPIVCLKSGITATQDEDGVWQLEE